MTEILQIVLAKKQLTTMPDAERRLFLLLGHASNEINVFQKLILMSGQGTTTIQFVDHVQSGQTFILLRTLIGKLHEAWELFRSRFQGDRQLAELYLPKLNDAARAAIVSLNKNFGKGSPLPRIRNGISFHYKDDGELVEKSFREIPDDESWECYLSIMQGNCFYYASELVVGAAVIKLANSAQDDAEPFLVATARSFAALCKLTIAVASDIQTLFGECITEIVSHNFPDLQPSESTNLTGLPALRHIHIPFFVDDTRSEPKDELGVSREGAGAAGT